MADVTVETTERDYLNMLANAVTLAQLRAGLLPWARFAPEALQVADRMSEREFREFRAAYATLYNHPTGEGEPTQQFMAKYGQLVMPDRLTDASRRAEQWSVTLGMVLLGGTGNQN